MLRFDADGRLKKERDDKHMKQDPILLKAVDLALTPDEILYLEEPYVPHPLAGIMAQNKPSAAKEKHVWSTGDQKIGN